MVKKPLQRDRMRDSAGSVLDMVDDCTNRLFSDCSKRSVLDMSGDRVHLFSLSHVLGSGDDRT